MKKKRVWCLYRVSGRKQVSVDDDIPIQRKSCLDFVKTKSDWEVTNELYEKGVSGWSKKAENRDEMNAIREGAINKEFDVLLVFMLDRLGRREDETPLVVQFLIDEGVEVWSVQEGQTKIEQHSDILMNFIRFWQSSGESKKTSLRVREAKKQLSEQGHFQGGRAPLGYKIVETEQRHWKVKDRMMKELVIDENEIELVKLIFSMYVDKHMGFRRIVNYLNENGYRFKDGRLFGLTTVGRIIKNPVYVGKIRYVGFDGKEGDTQPYNEKLRIISDDLFNRAQQILNTRKNTSNGYIQDKTEFPLAGKLMFSGLAFCKYCGKKIGCNYTYRKQKNKKTGTIYTYPIYRYRCSIINGSAKDNHERNMWAANKYDAIIIKEIKELFSGLDVKLFIETSVNKKKEQISLKEKNVKILKKEIDEDKKGLEKLNVEIATSLMGKSKFTPDQLSAAIKGTESKIQQTTETLNSLLAEIREQKENYSDINYMANELEDWEQKFDSADNNLKKAMLSRIINKVYLSKDEVEIEFELTLQKCLKNIKELSLT